jgi:hypothetical protein
MARAARRPPAGDEFVERAALGGVAAGWIRQPPLAGDQNVAHERVDVVDPEEQPARCVRFLGAFDLRVQPAEEIGFCCERPAKRVNGGVVGALQLPPALFTIREVTAPLIAAVALPMGVGMIADQVARQDVPYIVEFLLSGLPCGEHRAPTQEVIELVGAAAPLHGRSVERIAAQVGGEVAYAQPLPDGAAHAAVLGRFRPAWSAPGFRRENAADHRAQLLRIDFLSHLDFFLLVITALSPGWSVPDELSRYGS